MAEPPEDWPRYLGRKVSIRYRLVGSTHPYSEAIGVVQAVAPDEDGSEEVTILDRRGRSVVVATGDIVAAKIFPLAASKD